MKLIISTDLDRDRFSNLEKFIAEALLSARNTPGVTDVKILVSLDARSADLLPAVQKIASGYAGSCLVNFIDSSDMNLGYVYVSGYEIALSLGADIVLEMDSGGAFEVSEIPLMVLPVATMLSVNLQAKVGSMPDRFASADAYGYPKSRHLVARFGSFLTRSFLVGRIGKHVRDLTSGFQCFSATLLKAMLLKRPAKSWISSKFGPFYLVQSEAKALASYFADQLIEVPIHYGRKISGYSLDLKYYFQAGFGFVMLVLYRLLGK